MQACTKLQYNQLQFPGISVFPRIATIFLRKKKDSVVCYGSGTTPAIKHTHIYSVYLPFHVPGILRIDKNNIDGASSDLSDVSQLAIPVTTVSICNLSRLPIFKLSCMKIKCLYWRVS